MGTWAAVTYSLFDWLTGTEEPILKILNFGYTKRQRDRKAERQRYRETENRKTERQRGTETKRQKDRKVRYSPHRHDSSAPAPVHRQLYSLAILPKEPRLDTGPLNTTRPSENSVAEV